MSDDADSPLSTQLEHLSQTVTQQHIGTDLETDHLGATVTAWRVGLCIYVIIKGLAAIGRGFVFLPCTCSSHNKHGRSMGCHTLFIISVSYS